ncbi:PH domain-containing protein [Shewanella gaetbuli]
MQPTSSKSSEQVEHQCPIEQYDHGSNIAQDQFTTLSKLSLTAVDKNYPRMQLIVSSAMLATISILLTSFLVMASQTPLVINISIIGAFFILGLAIVRLIYLQSRAVCYGVFDHEFIMRKGLFWVSTTALPYTRLQHVNLSQGPVERRFSLSTLKCFSAGSGEAEIHLPGLSTQTAEHLRQHLLHQAAETQQADLDPED